jgi:chromosome segregation ATPase
MRNQKSTLTANTLLVILIVVCLGLFVACGKQASVQTTDTPEVVDTPDTTDTEERTEAVEPTTTTTTDSSPEALQREITNLRTQLATSNKARDDALAESSRLRSQLNTASGRLDDVFKLIALNEQNIADINSKTRPFRDQLSSWERMSDADLAKNAKSFTDLRNDFDGTYGVLFSKFDSLKRESDDFKRRFDNIQNAINRATQSQ